MNTLQSSSLEENDLIAEEFRYYLLSVLSLLPPNEDEKPLLTAVEANCSDLENLSLSNCQMGDEGSLYMQLVGMIVRNFNLDQLESFCISMAYYARLMDGLSGLHDFVQISTFLGEEVLTRAALEAKVTMEQGRAIAEQVRLA